MAPKLSLDYLNKVSVELFAKETGGVQRGKRAVLNGLVENTHS